MSKSRIPRRQALALRYEDHSGAPVVTAKGYGSVAENIILAAKEHGVFVHESPELVNLLMQVDLDSQIPESLYTVVAELLSWLYTMEKQAESASNKPL